MARHEPNPERAIPRTALNSRLRAQLDEVVANGDGVPPTLDAFLERISSHYDALDSATQSTQTASRAQVVASGERAVLERVAANAPLHEALEAIVDLVESVTADAMVSISVLASGAQRFELLCAPRLPPVLCAVLDNALIAIRNGSCAACVYLGRPVLVADVGSDPHWLSRRDVAVSSGVRSAWSVPIRVGNGRIAGALGLYRMQSGLPGRADIELMSDAARLAGIAIERRRAEEALRRSEARFRGLFESVIEGVYQSSPDGRLISVNPAFVKMLAYASSVELYALPSMAMLYCDGADRENFLRELERNGEVRNAELRLRRRDGQTIVVLANARAVRDSEGRTLVYDGTVTDITERTRAEQEVFREKERAQVTLQSIGDAVITADAAGRVDYMNPVAERLTGWSAAEAQGISIEAVLRLVVDISREPLPNPLLKALSSGASVGEGDECVLLDRRGGETAIQETAAPIRDRNGEVVGAVVAFHDVTRERRLRRALAHQAAHDPLTGLINRREFDSRLELALRAARELGVPHALLYIDLDQFKLVNDTCGHAAGDRLIREIAQLIQARVRSEDVIARLGGDEFGVLLQDCGLQRAGAVAETVRQSVRDHRFVWQGTTLSVGASIGVVELNAGTESAAALLGAADVACYSAKDQGRNRVELYEEARGQDRHREMKWAAQITRAIEQSRFELFAQPIKPLCAADVSRPFFELTCRMRDEEGRVVLPVEFIPAAERYGVMPMVDRWVLERAVAWLNRRSAAAESLPLIALNLSGTSFSDPLFLQHVLNLVGASGIAAALCFEVTETAAVSNLESAAWFMTQLKELGCRFALDDFGSGLSSLRYLKILPVDYIKIDGEFIARVADDAVDQSLVKAIVQVAHTLGIQTVAEKVETAAVRDALAALGVDHAQGFHVGRPAPLEGLAMGLV